MPDGFFLLGEPDFAHTTLADFLQEMIAVPAASAGLIAWVSPSSISFQVFVRLHVREAQVRRARFYGTRLYRKKKPGTDDLRSTSHCENVARIAFWEITPGKS